MDILDNLADAAFLFCRNLGSETNRSVFAAAADDFFQPSKSATADKQNVGGVNMEELLLRMFPAALRGNIGYRTFNNF